MKKDDSYKEDEDFESNYYRQDPVFGPLGLQGKDGLITIHLVSIDEIKIIWKRKMTRWV